MNAPQTHIDERSLSRLRWRCRRGLLENDLFVERFFAARGSAVTLRQEAGLSQLMDLPDNDLLDLLLRRTEPEGKLRNEAVLEVLELMRAPAPARGLPAASSEERHAQGPDRAPTAETNRPQPNTH